MAKGNTRNQVLLRVSRFVAGIVEGRDPDLATHHDNLGESAARFAKHIGCSAEEMELLCLGARVHDIGKLSISEHILNKPARLTAAEYSLVKRHTEIGKDLLQPLELDPRVGEIVHYHHENYDGTGYPQGLKGEATPFLARMVRILDSFDALTMNRPYQQGVSRDEALRRMEHDCRYYDPDLLRQFCQAIRCDVTGRLRQRD